MENTIDIVEAKLEKEIEKTNEMLDKVLIMVQNHDQYVSDGRNWRMTVIGLVFTMAMQVGGGLYLSGQITERVNNVDRLSQRVQEKQDRDEGELQKLIGERGANSGNNSSK